MLIIASSELCYLQSLMKKLVHLQFKKVFPQKISCRFNIVPNSSALFSSDLHLVRILNKVILRFLSNLGVKSWSNTCNRVINIVQLLGSNSEILSSLFFRCVCSGEVGMLFDEEQRTLREWSALENPPPTITLKVHVDALK